MKYIEETNTQKLLLNILDLQARGNYNSGHLKQE